MNRSAPPPRSGPGVPEEPIELNPRTGNWESMGFKYEILKKRTDSLGRLKYLVKKTESVKNEKELVLAGRKSSTTYWESKDTLPRRLRLQFEKSDVSKTFDDIKTAVNKEQRDNIKEELSEKDALYRRIRRARRKKDKETDFIPVVTTFDDKTLAKIESSVCTKDKNYFVVKFGDRKEVCLVESSDANKNFPQQVIKFYESLIQWSSASSDSTALVLKDVNRNVPGNADDEVVIS